MEEKAKNILLGQLWVVFRCLDPNAGNFTSNLLIKKPYLKPSEIQKN